MKQWQENLPTLNLTLLCIILGIILFTGFGIGPVNQTTLNNDAILKKLFSRYEIESCRTFDRYYFNKEMYVTRCTIKNNEYYFFLDKNGIIQNQIKVDHNKERMDFAILIDTFKLKNSKFMVIYYNEQLAYWIKSDVYEYIVRYDNFEILMKVRF